MTSIKMIAVDLDGTLLPASKQITPRTARVLHELHRRGVKLVIATGRPVRGVQRFLPEVPFDAVICHNGAVIHLAGKEFARYPIPEAVLKPFARRLLQAFPDISMLMEYNDEMHVNFNVQTIWDDIEAKRTDFRSLDLDAADKIILLTSEEATPERLTPLLSPELYMDISIDGSIALIMHKNARKNLAIAEVARCFGFTLEDVASFGDDVNDLLMVKECTYGVAMSNAIDSVRQAATYRTLSCEEDGVAVWLAQRFGLEELL